MSFKFSLSILIWYYVNFIICMVIAAVQNGVYLLYYYSNFYSVPLKFSPSYLLYHWYMCGMISVIGLAML